MSARSPHFRHEDFKELIARSALGSFDPLSLSPSYFFNAANATSRFQSGTRGAPGSAAAANNDPIGLLLDLSGNNRDISQATAGKRPLYQTSGGLHWVLFDGVDDFLFSASYATSQPFFRISAIRVLSLAATGRMFGQKDGANTPAFAYDTLGSASIFSGASLASPNGTIVAATDIVVTEIHNGVSSSIQIDNGATTSGDAGALTDFGFSMGGADFAATFYCNARCSSVFAKMGSIPSAPQIAQLKTFMGSLQGRVL